MSIVTGSTSTAGVEYPDSDGEPMAENTLQYRWIVTIKEGLDALLRDREAFVAADLFWYPVQGDPGIRTAPDVLVALGRPRGERGSYKLWEEENIAPQVVFEVLSPGNRPGEMEEKRGFYERYGVQEYYIYDPDEFSMDGWIREEDRLKPLAAMDGWISPKLGIRFDLSHGELVILDPHGERFRFPQEVYRDRDRLEVERNRLEAERDDAIRRAETLAAQLRALGIEPPT